MVEFLGLEGLINSLIESKLDFKFQFLNYSVKKLRLQIHLINFKIYK